jgi:hypothetical protein
MRIKSRNQKELKSIQDQTCKAKEGLFMELDMARDG